MSVILNSNVDTSGTPCKEVIFSIEVPIILHSPNGNYEVWQVRHSRRNAERKKVNAVLGKYEPPTLLAQSTLRVRITRISSRTMDGDNLQFAAKTLRDAIASWVGLDDADKRIRWSYNQEVVRERISVLKDGKLTRPFRSWVRVDFVFLEVDTQPEATLPEPEDWPYPGEPRILYEHPISWETAPGVDLLAVHRMRGRKGVKPAVLHVAAKEFGELKYIHICTHFVRLGKKYRSRGAMVMESELPAVVAALQEHLRKMTDRGGGEKK